MCGVVGVKLRRPGDDDLELIKRLFLETKIRGLHATGIAWAEQGKVQIVKEPLPADKFLNTVDLSRVVNRNSGQISFIGHVRYSTSDLDYNQPLGDSRMAIVHNGVVTQADPEYWPERYGMSFITRNDSEILLNYLVAEQWPDHYLQGASEAWLTIDSKDRILVYRNGKRPLWYTVLYSRGVPCGTLVASTSNILKRTLRGSKYIFDIKKCEVGTVYEQQLTDLHAVDYIQNVEEWQKNYERETVST
jgi:glutamine phosphoribosylpyrophosphate amidotransferase